MGLLRTKPNLSISPVKEWDCPQLNVVRCALAQPKPADDWRRTTILQTLILINDKVCKVIIDSGSCINAISQNTVARTMLKAVPHPHPYKVSWVDSTFLSITERCLVPLQLVGYKDKIWCDIIAMDVGSIILGRPWLFDVDATIFGKSNSCVFTFEGCKIRIKPMEPKPKPTPKNHKATDTRKAIHLVTAKVFEREVKNEPLAFALVTKKYPETQDVIPPEVPPILEEFQSVFPSDLPESLPPLLDIQHAID